jgi:hypothetical protein
MSAQMEVPVFYRDQDESLEAPCRVISRDEARKLKKLGLGYFIAHGRQFRLHEIEPKIETLLPPSGTTQASTISLSELLANVGITEAGELDHIGKVRRARIKIRLYPHVGDEQAPLARPYSNFTRVSDCHI